MAARTSELRDLLNRLITVQEDERRRIARDLHDDIGQKMTALHLKLEALRRAQRAGSKVQKQVEEAQLFVQQLDRDLDFFTWELRAAALYDLGLAQALRDFVNEWSTNYRIAAEFQQIGFAGERLRPDMEINFYRIAQEALNNVYKHAKASKVDVVLQRRDSEIVLSIEDDGIGVISWTAGNSANPTPCCSCRSSTRYRRTGWSVAVLELPADFTEDKWMEGLECGLGTGPWCITSSCRCAPRRRAPADRVPRRAGNGESPRAVRGRGGARGDPKTRARREPVPAAAADRPGNRRIRARRLIPSGSIRVRRC